MVIITDLMTLCGAGTCKKRVNYGSFLKLATWS